GRGGRNTRGEIAIRGIGDFSRNIGNDARVVVYVDGVPMVRSSTFNINLMGTEQIEVLRGPQGTLFGTNTIAGAINIRTNGPSEQLANAIHIEGGSFNHRSVSLTSSLPVSDSVQTLLQYNKTKNDGFIHNISLNKDLQGIDSEAARLKIKLRPSDKLEINTSIDWLNEYSQATNGVAIADDGAFNGFSTAPSPREVAHNAEEFEKREVLGASVEVDYTLDNYAEIISISAYRDNQFSELNEEDYSPIPAIFSIFNEKSQQVSQEFRLVSPRFESFDYVMGLFYLGQDINTDRLANLGGNVVTTPGNVNIDSYAIYGHGNYRFAPKLELSLGARYVIDEKTIDFNIIDGIGLFTNGNISESKTFKEFLPKASLNYKASDTSLLYTSVSRGYKAGGWNADFVTTLDDIDFDEETATNIEVGYKSNYLDSKLNVNLAAFLVKVKNLQVFQFVQTDDTTTLLKLTNAGEASSRGVEMELGYTLNSYMSLTFNTAYTQATFDSFKNGGGTNIDYDDNDLPYAPELKTFLAFDFEVPLTDAALFQAHLDYSYSDGYFTNPNNAENYSVGSFDTINGRVGLDLNKMWEISLWGKNLTDNTNLRYRDISFAGVPRGYYEAPRSYGLGLTLKL
ncbi:MAG: iron complex outermembrane receptor protein, partial [Lentisphaeria bacterium]